MNENEILSKINTARKYYQEQSFDLAENLFEEIIEILADDEQNLPVMQIELGWTYYHLGKFAKVIEILQKAQSSGQLDLQQQFDCRRLIGFSFEMLGDNENAMTAIEDALSYDIPEHVKRYTIFEMAKLLFTRGNLLKAEEYLRMADPLFQNEELSYKTAISYYLGFCCYFQKQFDEARDHFEFIIAKTDDIKVKASGYFGLTHLHYHDKDYITIVDLCEKILRLDPDFFDKETLGYFLAFSYFNQQKWEQLESVLEEMEKGYPNGRYIVEYKKFRDAVDESKTKNDENN